jgi:hypothetical protein
MWGKNIVESFSEPMAMDTGEDLRLRAAVIPPLAQAEGSPDRIFMGGLFLITSRNFSSPYTNSIISRALPSIRI